MNRGELRAEVRDLIEDVNDATFSLDRLDRHIQRAAASVHAMLVQLDGVNYGRGLKTLTMAGTKALLITSFADTEMEVPIYLRKPRPDTATGASFGRRSIGVVVDDFARIIPESQRSSTEYVCGVDYLNRPVCFFLFDGSAPSNPWTIEFLVAQSGVWELVYVKKVKIIPPDSASDDDEIYDTIPSQWEPILNHRAAISVLGNHNEDAQGLIQFAQGMEADIKRTLMLGTTVGSVQQA